MEEFLGKSGQPKNDIIGDSCTSRIELWKMGKRLCDRRLVTKRCQQVRASHLTMVEINACVIQEIDS